MKNTKSYLFLSLLFFQCRGNVDKEFIGKDIRQRDWKHGEGASLGDWIDFKSGVYSISSDTIFHYDSAVAVVSHFERASLGDDYEMEIKLLENGREGIYHSK